MNTTPTPSNLRATENIPARRLNKVTPPWLWLGAAVWLVTILTALAWMTNYSFTPGPLATTLANWPEASRIDRDAARPTLLLFAHPRCPCSRATIGELARLAANCQDRFTAQVWFTKPAGVAVDWEQTDLWRTAAAIPGVSVHTDEAGNEAARFGAQTSGHAMLYDSAGQLLFQGGITLSRGHSGDNPGRTTLQNILEGRKTPAPPTPIFGCALVETLAPNQEVVCHP